MDNIRDTDNLVLDVEIRDILRIAGFDIGVISELTNTDLLRKDEVERDFKFKSERNKYFNLRTLFWAVIDNCRKNNKPYASAYEFYSGVCNGVEYGKLLRDKDFCIFLLNVQTDHDIKLMSLLNEQGFEVYKDILLSDTSTMSKAEITGLKLKLDAISRIEDRVKGTITHKVAIDNNITQNSNINIIKQNVKDQSLEDLRKDILMLEEQLNMPKSNIPENPHVLNVQAPHVLIEEASKSRNKDLLMKAVEIEYKKDKLSGNTEF